MGRLDFWAKKFFRRPEIFADLFNGYLFQGKSVLLPSELVPQDTTEVFTSQNSKRHFGERERDLLKKVTCKSGQGYTFLLLGLEAQSFPDASMPLRCMLYDALNYSEQLKTILQENARLLPSNKDTAFFLGLPENVRLTPIITLVVALTDEPWPRERELHDLLALPDTDLTQFIPNYSINLITPKTMSEEDILPYGEELGAVLLAAKNAKDRKGFREDRKSVV